MFCLQYIDCCVLMFTVAIDSLNTHLSHSHSIFKRFLYKFVIQSFDFQTFILTDVLNLLIIRSKNHFHYIIQSLNRLSQREQIKKCHFQRTNICTNVEIHKFMTFESKKKNSCLSNQMTNKLNLHENKSRKLIITWGN